MNFESSSIAAIAIGAVAVLASIVYALVRVFSVRSRLRRISDSPALVAVSKLPALGERIAAGVENLKTTGDRWEDLVERLMAARDASTRLQSAIDSIAACVIDLLETFAPSLRGIASNPDP